jgi:hypothetical protein
MGPRAGLDAVEVEKHFLSLPEIESQQSSRQLVVIKTFISINLSTPIYLVFYPFVFIHHLICHHKAVGC